MADPRLNSVHLDGSRREAFRRAREQLVDARGMQTLAGEEYLRRAPVVSPTIVQNKGEDLPANVGCCLLDKELVYPLRVGLNTIGRAPDNDVVIADAYVSRRQCAILVHAGDGCELHDVASKNGTFLNGQKLDGPTPLHSGDEIRMCDRQLVFMLRGGEDAHQRTFRE
jgi:hypothetical protein